MMGITETTNRVLALDSEQLELLLRSVETPERICRLVRAELARRSFNGKKG